MTNHTSPRFQPSAFNLSALALKHPALVVFAMLAMIVAGIQAFATLGRAEDPAFTFKIMVVQTRWPGASARDMELQVTDKLEKIIQQVSWFDIATSYSRPGESVIMVQLRDDAPSRDVADAWYQVRKHVNDQKDTLPQGVQGPFFNDEFGDTFGTIYAFMADGFSDAELKAYVDGVRQRLLRVKNVAKAELLGDQEERIFIEFSHQRLATIGITSAQMLDTLEKQTAMAASGVIETPTDRVAIRVGSAVKSEEALADLPITVGTRTVRIGDVADVRRGYEDPKTFTMRVNGRPAIGLMVSMSKGGNILEQGKALAAEIGQIKRDMPAGIEIFQVADQPKVVEESIAEFLRSLGEALAIVLIVSFLSLGWRTGLVVAFSVPLVLAITFVIMKMAGIDLHRVSLGALIIALGLLVDDAIIAVEMMMVKLEEGYSRFEAASFAYSSTALPMLTGTLVTAAGFIPVAFGKSGSSEYTMALFWVIGIALIVSWITAVVFTPYLGFHLLPKIKQEDAAAHAGRYSGKAYDMFRRLLNWSIAHRKTVVGATAGLFVASVVMFGFVPQQFFPASERPELLVDLRLAGGSSFTATEAAVEKLESRLKSNPDIAHYTVYTGGGTPRFYLSLNLDLANPAFAQAVVMTRDAKARERVLERLRTLLDTELSAINGRVSRLENGPAVGFPVQFRILGKNPQVVRRVAEQVADVIRANPHTRDVNFDWHEMSKQVTLEIDRARARALGITPQDLSRAMETLFSGTTVAEVRDGTELIRVIARAIPAERMNLDDLAAVNFSVPDPVTGGKRTMSLDQVATLKSGFEEPVLWRRNRDVAMLARAEIRDATQPPVVSTQIDAELEKVRRTLPEGYRIEMAGSIAESAKGQAAIIAVVPVMILVMLTILIVQLQSFQRLAMVVLTAPLGLIGVTFSLLIFRQPYGFVAMLGVIALAGMIMRNSVILVEQIDSNIRDGQTPFDAIIDATIHRARPVLLTAAAAILAMIPLARTGFWGPMAVAIMGGLAVATGLTLVFLPALYALWFKVKSPAETQQMAV